MQNLRQALTRHARTFALSTMTRPFTASAKPAPTFVERWETIKKQAEMGGGQARIDKQHS